MLLLSGAPTTVTEIVFVDQRRLSQSPSPESSVNSSARAPQFQNNKRLASSLTDYGQNDPTAAEQRPQFGARNLLERLGISPLDLVDGIDSATDRIPHSDGGRGRSWSHRCGRFQPFHRRPLDMKQQTLRYLVQRHLRSWLSWKRNSVKISLTPLNKISQMLVKRDLFVVRQRYSALMKVPNNFW